MDDDVDAPLVPARPSPVSLRRVVVVVEPSPAGPPGRPGEAGYGDAPALDRLRTRLNELVPGGTDVLEIDLSRVDRLSSASVSTLLTVKRACTARGVQVVVVPPAGRTGERLARTGLGDALQVRSAS